MRLRNASQPSRVWGARRRVRAAPIARNGQKVPTLPPVQPLSDSAVDLRDLREHRAGEMLMQSMHQMELMRENINVTGTIHYSSH